RLTARVKGDRKIFFEHGLKDRMLVVARGGDALLHVVVEVEDAYDAARAGRAAAQARQEVFGEEAVACARFDVGVFVAARRRQDHFAAPLRQRFVITLRQTLLVSGSARALKRADAARMAAVEGDDELTRRDGAQGFGKLCAGNRRVVDRLLARKVNITRQQVLARVS